MGIQCTASFEDQATGLSFDNAFLSFNKSQVIVMPDGNGGFGISSNAGVWLNKDCKTNGKAPLTWSSVTISASQDDIKKGVYDLLYAALKTQSPTANDA